MNFFRYYSTAATRPIPGAFRVTLVSTVMMICSVTAGAQKQPLLDLNADNGVTISESNRVESWTNSVANATMQTFDGRDEGRMLAGSGRPTLRKNVNELDRHHSLSFL